MDHTSQENSQRSEWNTAARTSRQVTEIDSERVVRSRGSLCGGLLAETFPNLLRRDQGEARADAIPRDLFDGGLPGVLFENAAEGIELCSGVGEHGGVLVGQREPDAFMEFPTGPNRQPCAILEGSTVGFADRSKRLN